MRTFPAVFSLSLLALGSAAHAADLPLKAPPPAVVTVYNWTGFYIGGNIGGKWGDLDTPIGIAATASTAASFGCVCAVSAERRLRAAPCRDDELAILSMPLFIARRMPGPRTAIPRIASC